MRGLAFPHNADADRENSHEYGTPISNVDDIHIDPALAGTVIDPALMMEDTKTNGVEYQPEPEQPVFEHPPSLVDDVQLKQYSEVPEGDPFAQQMPPSFFPILHPQPPPPPKPKRKRRVRREDTCGFCGGDESKNKLGGAEILLTCHECGRSGHPSCMQLTRVADVVRTYPWKCIECKNCELCQEKGDDDRILFCDWCDRGWHMDCMIPPLEEPPDGEWHCPLCPPVVPGEDQMLEGQETDEIEVEVGDDTTREVSATSRSPVEAPSIPVRKGRKKASGKGRGRTSRAPVVADSPEPDESIDVDIEDTPVAASKNRGRPRKSTARQRAIATGTSDEEEVETSPRPTKRRRAPARVLTPPAPLLRVRLRLPGQRGKGKEREEEETSHGLFDEILAPDDRDTTKTMVTNNDKLYFERSRITAEEKITQTTTQPTASSSTRTLEHMDDFLLGRSRPLRSSTLQHTSPLPRRVDFSNSPGPSTPGGGGSMPPALKFEPGVLRIRNIRFGPYDIKTWYDAPFPEEYASIPDGKLWICEFCLKYMKSPFAATRHQMKCKARHPPGDEIYRDAGISIFEVDGRRNKIYCQNLCLLSKMFLDHKSLFYDVEPFLFYVITQVDEFGARFVGYFSKEKRCPKDYNLSCIMTLPVRQRQGWGNLLIDFSYLLSKIEQRTGTPEKPLSSLGALGYGKYWTLAVMRFLRTAPDNVELEDISSATAMTIEDVCNTLTQQNMIYVREPMPPPIRPSPGQSIKFPRGRKNGLARRQFQKLQAQDNPTVDGRTSTQAGAPALFVPPKNYEIHFDREKVSEYLRNWEAKGYVKLKPEKLQWTPYITSRIPQEANLPAMPAMDTVLDESSKGSTQPSTPAAENDDSAESEDVERDDDELPSIVDRPGRTRRRSMKTATMDLPTLRSTRSHRVRSASPPLSSLTPSRSLRTRSSNANVVPLSEDTPSLRSTQRGTAGKKTSGRAQVDMVSNDEAFAVQLAMEEQMQQRQLRSRRNELQSENKLAVQVPGPTKTIQSRKRRRVDSSPEVVDKEDQAESEHPADDGDAGQMDVDPVVVPRVNGNEVHDLVNERQPDDGVETDTPEQTLVNHVSTEEESAVVQEVVEVLVVDVKSEDAGTPLTGLTSRQSVPSDDTVFTGPCGYPKHAESDLRSTLLIDLDECHDEDADGEYEEDAEGLVEIY